MHTEKTGNQQNQPNSNSWGNVEEWATRHPFNKDLYLNESEYRAAYHINESREKMISEAAGTKVGYKVFDEAYAKAEKEKTSIYEALLSIAAEDINNEDAQAAVDEFINMSVIDVMAKESDYNAGLCSGLLKYSEMQRRSIEVYHENGRISEIDYRYNSGAMDYLEDDIQNYRATEAFKQEPLTVPQYFKREEGSLLQRIQFEEKLGREPRDSDVMRIKGIRYGLNFLASVMNDYQDNKATLDKVISGSN